MPTEEEEILAEVQALAEAVSTDKAVTTSNLDRTRTNVSLSKANKDASALSASTATGAASSALAYRDQSKAYRDELAGMVDGTVPRGEWELETVYAIGDQVTRGGSGYRAIAASLAVDPLDDVSGSATVGAYWALYFGTPPGFADDVVAVQANATAVAEQREAVDITAGEVEVAAAAVAAQKAAVDVKAAAATADAAAALAAKADALVAAAAAELSAQAAFASGIFYATTAAGIAATVDGEFFLVVGDGTNSYALLYENESEVATLRTTYPSKAALDAVSGQLAELPEIKKRRRGQILLAIMDENDVRSPFVVTPTKIKHAQIDAINASVASVNRRVQIMTMGNIVLALLGSGGYSPLVITQNKIKHPDTDAMRAKIAALEEQVAGGGDTPTVTSGWSRTVAERVMVIRNGQSLSLGVGGLPITTTSLVALAYALMFDSGIRLRDGSAPYDTLVDLVETAPDSTYGETGLWGCAQTIYRMLLAEDGADLVDDLGQKLIFTAPGEGSQSALDLSPGEGGGYFERLVAGIEGGAAAALAAGLTFDVGMMLWVQGEQDYADSTGRAIYETRVEAIRAAVQAERALVSKFGPRLPAATSQLATHPYRSNTVPEIALAQLSLARRDEWSLTAPLYFLPRSDGQHLDEVGSKWLGGYEAIAVKRRLFDGARPKWLDAGQAFRDGRHLIIPYDVPVGRLQWDTTIVDAHPDGTFGFAVVDQDDIPVAIETPAIIGGTHVRLTAESGDMPALAKWRYAWTGDAQIGWGNLRDEQGDTLVVDPSGINKPLHNFAPIDEGTVA